MSAETKARARILQLEEKEAASNSQRRHRVVIGNEPQDLKVFQVLNNVPKYRVENNRIAAEIDALKSDPGTAEILKDPFDDRAQELIERELLKLVKKASLERLILASRVQEEPLLLTRDGVVVNGNRRLTILRKHNIGNGFVDVCLLPKGVGEEEISLIEFRLQMDDPGKADYSWINQLIAIRRAIDSGISVDKIQASMPSLSKGDFEKLRTSLDAIDMFLERRGTPGQYGELGEGVQYFFDELRLAIKKHKRYPDKIDALLWMAVNYYDHDPKDEAEDRAFMKLKKATKQLGRVQQNFGQIEIPEQVNEDPDDPLAGIAGAESVYKRLEIDGAVASQIHEIVLAGEDQDARNKNAAQLFSDLQTAARKLVNAEIDSKTANLRGILEQLTIIGDHVGRLKDAAIKHKKQAG
jgi:hypothetical protein